MLARRFMLEARIIVILVILGLRRKKKINSVPCLLTTKWSKYSNNSSAKPTNCLNVFDYFVGLAPNG